MPRSHSWLRELELWAAVLQGQLTATELSWGGASCASAEHRRFAHYRQALETVTEADEADLVAAVLRDQDATMEDSAVGSHLDRRPAD